MLQLLPGREGFASHVAVEIELIDKPEQPIRSGVEQFAAKFDTIGSFDGAKGNEYVPANTLDFAAHSKMKRSISLERRPVYVACPSASAKPLSVLIPYL
jgi:hypothetical protein